MKERLSRNPPDERVSLRNEPRWHAGDFFAFNNEEPFARDELLRQT
jgi:hypothetical protein